ncbi:hypothetical protein Mth01_26810 [Sphaerimonospora thailandensis]|uniref:Uncharacterized protein n=2 Tax=Sphaerimonospora TaxID=1792303 RepID=A0A8J3VZU7_9ACTN|nr:hypothetical protein Mth01_26810 [Sphaerimonospora thailandensis]
MIFEWVNLGFNLQDGHDTAFYVVHGVLIAVNVILGLVLGVLGVRGLLASAALTKSATGIKERKDISM